MSQSFTASRHMVPTGWNYKRSKKLTCKTVQGKEIFILSSGKMKIVQIGTIKLFRESHSYWTPCCFKRQSLSVILTASAHFQVLKKDGEHLHKMGTSPKSALPDSVGIHAFSFLWLLTSSFSPPLSLSFSLLSSYFPRIWRFQVDFQRHPPSFPPPFFLPF